MLHSISFFVLGCLATVATRYAVRYASNMYERISRLTPNQVASVTDDTTTRTSSTTNATGATTRHTGAHNLGDKKVVMVKGKPVEKVWALKANGTCGWRRATAVAKENDTATPAPNQVESTPVAETPVETETAPVSEPTTTPKKTRSTGEHKVGDEKTIVKAGKTIVKVWCEKEDGTFGWRRKSALEKASKKDTTTPAATTTTETPAPAAAPVETPAADTPAAYEWKRGEKLRVFNIWKVKLAKVETREDMDKVQIELDALPVEVRAYLASNDTIKSAFETATAKVAALPAAPVSSEPTNKEVKEMKSVLGIIAKAMQNNDLTKVVLPLPVTVNCMINGKEKNLTYNTIELRDSGVFVWVTNSDNKSYKASLDKTVENNKDKNAMNAAILRTFAKAVNETIASKNGKNKKTA